MTRGAETCWVWFFCTLTFSSIALAQDLPPLGSAVRSLEVIEDGAIVLVEPHEGAARRGTLALGARFAVTRRVATPPSRACEAGAWARIADEAWVCASSLAASAAPPGAEREPRMPNEALLPFRYAFVRDDGARAYARPEDVEADDFAQTFGEGFGLSLTEHVRYGGEGFSRTRRGLWVEDASLRPAAGSDFVGVAVDGAAALGRVAWVVREGARLTDAHRRERRRAHRLEALVVTGEPRRGTLAVDDGGTPVTVAARDVARPTITPRPDGVAEDEPWIDVDVGTQTLVAYEGDRPVYATLVSTGRAGRTHQTPLGVHRLWAKLATSDMDDLEREDVERNYRIEDVPWVQFFAGSAGLHAAFWHDHFGERHSHGCVNLAPRDARALFERTRPLLPPGWTAILPTAHDPGSVVRVR